jgi:hypothetical protein
MSNCSVHGYGSFKIDTVIKILEYSPLTFLLFPFAGFSADCVAERILDSKCTDFVTADGKWGKGRSLRLKAVCDSGRNIYIFVSYECFRFYLTCSSLYPVSDHSRNAES